MMDFVGLVVELAVELPVGLVVEVEYLFVKLLVEEGYFKGYRVVLEMIDRL